MNPPYPSPSGYPPAARRRGPGCFAVGCMIVVGLGVLFVLALGGTGFYLYRTVRPFVSTAPTPVRIYPATEAQYSAVLEKWRVFGNTLATDHAATLQLSADDLNTLIARAPEAQGLRGSTSVSLANNEIALAGNFPLPAGTNRPPGQPVYYFTGKLYFSVSFDNGELNLDFHKIETLDGKPAPALLEAVVEHPNFSRAFNRSFNDSLRGKMDRNPGATEFLDKVRSLGIRNNQLVLTAADR